MWKLKGIERTTTRHSAKTKRDGKRWKMTLYCSGLLIPGDTDVDDVLRELIGKVEEDKLAALISRGYFVLWQRSSCVKARDITAPGVKGKAAYLTRAAR